MPPRKRAETPSEDTTTPSESESTTPEICRVCWPAGWPEGDTYAATCEHGQWTYPARRPKA